MENEFTTVEIRNTPYCYENSIQSVIENIANRVRELRKAGKLTPEVLGTLRKYFRIKNIYHSNAIEGNLLNIGETRQVVELGLTITGKPLKDQAEAKNLSEATDYLEALVNNADQSISEIDIRQIHSLVLRGIDDENEGRYRNVPVEISGSKFKPPAPESVPAQMGEFSGWLKSVSCADQGFGAIDGLLNAAVAHTWFVFIHPFIDGNGRVARLLMNLLLMRHGYPIAIITREDRLRYYDALEAAQSSDLTGLLVLIIECLHESLEEYEQAADEQRQREEWALSLANKFAARGLTKAKNEYEIWKNAMDLFSSYFRQTAEIIDEVAPIGRVYFRDFATLEFEKYLSLKQGASVKKAWFFRVDFAGSDRTIRYLFFFGFPSVILKGEADVTIHVAREEPPGSYSYERLEYIGQINPHTVPRLIEVGYQASNEEFIYRTSNDEKGHGKVELICKNFFNDVIDKHFQN